MIKLLYRLVGRKYQVTFIFEMCKSKLWARDEPYFLRRVPIIGEWIKLEEPVYMADRKEDNHFQYQNFEIIYVHYDVKKDSYLICLQCNQEETQRTPSV